MAQKKKTDKPARPADPIVNRRVAPKLIIGMPDLIAARPETDLDESYRKRLKNHLLRRYDEIQERRAQKRRAWALFRMPGRLVGTLSGALAFLVVVGVTVYLNRQAFLPVRTSAVDAEKAEIVREMDSAKANGPAPKNAAKDDSRTSPQKSFASVPASPESKADRSGFKSRESAPRGEKPSDTERRDLALTEEKESQKLKAAEDEISAQALSGFDRAGTPEESAAPSAAPLREPSGEGVRDKKTASVVLALSIVPALYDRPDRYDAIDRALENGRWPKAEKPRPLEWVNAFRYALPGPASGEIFAVRTEMARCPWDKNADLLMIGLAARDKTAVSPAILAWDLRIRTVFSPGTVSRAGLIGHEDILAVRHTGDAQNRPEAVLQEGDQVSLLFLVERNPAFAGISSIGTVTVFYKTGAGGDDQSREYPVSGVVRTNPSGDFRFASAVAGWALKKSGQLTPASWSDDGIIRAADQSAAGDPLRLRFVEMVREGTR